MIKLACVTLSSPSLLQAAPLHRLNRFATKQERTVRKFNVDQLKTLLLKEMTLTRLILLLGHLILWLNLKRELWCTWNEEAKSMSEMAKWNKQKILE